MDNRFITIFHGPPQAFLLLFLSLFMQLQGKPVVILKGITIMGVPIPNAWLGGIKNIDLVKEFGTSKGFWKTFSDGIEDIKIEEGRLKIKLKE